MHPEKLMTHEIARRQDVMVKNFLSSKLQGAFPVIHAWCTPCYLEQIAGHDQQVKLTPADAFLLTQHRHQGFGQITVTHFDFKKK